MIVWYEYYFRQSKLPIYYRFINIVLSKLTNAEEAEVITITSAVNLLFIVV